MIKKESCQQKTSKSSTNNTKKIASVPIASNSANIGLSRYSFLEWTMKLATEQRYVALRLKMPQEVSQYRQLCKRILGVPKAGRSELKINYSKNLKALEEPYQTFLDSLVFMTDEDYLDCIGFEYGYVENPEKLFELLMTVKNHQRQKVEEKCNEQIIYLKDLTINNIASYEEWVQSLAQKIEKALIIKTKTKFDIKIFEDEKNQKKDFVSFWKIMNEEDREGFLRLQCETDKTFEGMYTEHQVSFKPNDISSEIADILKSEKKDLCNRIFKAKVKKLNPFYCDYYEIVFNRWRTLQKINKKKKYHGKRKNKKNKRPKSIDAMSNETNETQIKEGKFQFDVKGIANEKLERDIYDYSDQISLTANDYFEARVLAFERLKYLLEPYGIKIKLYGSCACGIAIQNSDLDIAVDDEILEMFGYSPTPQKQVQEALRHIQQILSLVTFTSDIKSISSAYIPIIKFKIDPTQQFYCQEPYLYSHLNRTTSTRSVQIDLTIETRSETSSQIATSLPQHLGLKSTEQISKWLEQYPCLRPILLILKHQLTLNQLNETYNAGLNTYTLIVMLVAVQKWLKITKQQKVGVVMEKILRFWAVEFNPKATGVYLKENIQDNSEIFYQKSNWRDQVSADQTTKISAELEIRDPLNNNKIMTKNCYRFSQIQDLFSNIYNTCIHRGQQKVQEVCSYWNPKEQKLNTEQLSEWVLGELKGNQFEKLVV